MPTVTIDGKQVTIPREATVLQAARKAGIWIPTLCHHPVVSAPAACRICLVELAGQNGKPGRLVTSCNYPVLRDLEVSVSSPRAVRARRGVMELLLARAPDSGELNDLAARMGVRGTPYPKVTESQRNCILCGLCVSVCEEVIEAAAIGFTGRGADKAVAAPFRQPSETCIACGACAAVCPVGTIQVRIHADSGEAEISPFKSRSKLLVCEGCGRKPVTQPVAQQMLDRLDGGPIDWGELRALARLCPECRRRRAAASLGRAAEAGGGATQPIKGTDSVQKTNGKYVEQVQKGVSR